MKSLCFAVGTALIACAATGFTQTQATCGSSLDAPLRSRGTLTIESRPAGLEIVGTDRDTIHVSCTTDDVDRAEQVHVRFSAIVDDGKLTISGGTMRQSNLKIRVEVPRRTNLSIHMGAGQVIVEDVTGDKVIALYAGQITISGLHGLDYRRIEASVDVGDVDAQAYGADKGGFFRTFTHKTSGGEYRLYAHVVTGQIELVGNGETAE
jgi:hypothetical protein